MRHIYSIYAYSVFILLTLLLTLILVFIPSLTQRRRLARFTARAILFCIGIKVDVSGHNNIPERSSIVIANHASYLDGLLLTAILPPRFTFVIKREVTDVPVLHFLLRRLGSHFVERSNRTTAANHLKKMIRMSQNDESIALFPEGTFRHTPGLRPFQKGAFAVAHKTKQPLVPILIHGARKVLPADEWKIKRLPMQVNIMLSIDPSEFANVADLKNELQNYFEKAIGHN